MPESNYAIMVPCTDNYLPGLTALLNGLDLYENTADVWVINFGIAQEYQNKALSAGFGFGLHFYPNEELTEGEYALGKGRDSGFYYCVFSPYVLQARFKDKYDAVAMIGADVVVVNNIMNWFEAAAKSGLLITAGNPYTLTQPGEIPPNTIFPNGLLDVSPVADVPLFMNPKVHFDVILETLRWGKYTNENLKAINSAIYHLGKSDRLLLLNSQLWTCGLFYMFRTQVSEDKKGRKIYYANSERINAIHKKYWSDDVIYSALFDKIPGTFQYENTYNNTKIFSEIYRRLCMNYKLKYDYPKNEVFDKLQRGELKLKYQLEK